MRSKWIFTLLWLTQSIFAHTGKIDDILSKISVLYVDSKPVSELREQAIAHIISDLDTYSSYLPISHAEQVHETLDGEYSGIGLSLDLIDNELLIDTILPDSPAENAGLKSGDKITHINGFPIDSESLETNVLRIRNQKKTHLTLTLENNKTIKLKRDKINRGFIKYQDKGSIGYIQIYLFSKKTPSQLQELLEKTNHDAYLIDLRHNPGGLLYSSIKSSTLFLKPKQDMPLTQIQNRNGLHDIYIERNAADHIHGKPLYILLGPHSASGAELFSSILQHYKRATILGETSKGKGSIQALIPLEDDSFLKLTTAYFTTPDGLAIHKKGISPNIPMDIDSIPPSLSYITDVLDTSSTNAIQ